MRNSKAMSGAAIARQILNQNQLPDIKITEHRGALTDHYDPRRGLVALSTRIFRDESVASAAIAAHESGHALQDRDHYGPMQIRYALLPMAQLGAQYGPWAAIIGGIIGSPTMMQVGMASFGIALAFQLLSLPIEFNASRRAKDELEQMGFTSAEDREGARKVLFAAAMTYVANAATAMGHVFFVLLFFGRKLTRQKTQ